MRNCALTPCSFESSDIRIRSYWEVWRSPFTALYPHSNSNVSYIYQWFSQVTVTEHSWFSSPWDGKFQNTVFQVKYNWNQNDSVLRKTRIQLATIWMEFISSLGVSTCLWCNISIRYSGIPLHWTVLPLFNKENKTSQTQPLCLACGLELSWSAFNNPPSENGKNNPISLTGYANLASLSLKRVKKYQKRDSYLLSV